MAAGLQDHVHTTAASGQTAVGDPQPGTQPGTHPGNLSTQAPPGTAETRQHEPPALDDAASARAWVVAIAIVVIAVTALVWGMTLPP